jgi:hypothetical protein
MKAKDGDTPYLSPRGQMRIGQPDVDRADAEDGDPRGLLDAVRHAVIMEGCAASIPCVTK